MNMNEKVIPVLNQNGAEIAKLVPIGHKECDLDTAVTLITKWRNFNKKCFLTEFETTEERTRNWIHNFWLNSQNQTLFLVAVGETFVGHFGFKELTSRVLC